MLAVHLTCSMPSRIAISTSQLSDEANRHRGSTLVHSAGSQLFVTRHYLSLQVQRRRPDLRIIVSSATLEVERLTAFFDTSTTRGSRRTVAAEAGGLPSRAPIVLGVEGRTHPVQVSQGAPSFVLAW